MKDHIFETIDVVLKADNSNGSHTLTFCRQDHNGMYEEEEYYAILTGDYKGKPIQIDFNSLSRDKISDMIEALTLLKGL